MFIVKLVLVIVAFFGFAEAVDGTEDEAEAPIGWHGTSVRHSAT